MQLVLHQTKQFHIIYMIKYSRNINENNSATVIILVKKYSKFPSNIRATNSTHTWGHMFSKNILRAFFFPIGHDIMCNSSELFSFDKSTNRPNI